MHIFNPVNSATINHLWGNITLVLRLGLVRFCPLLEHVWQKLTCQIETLLSKPKNPLSKGHCDDKMMHTFII